jgi:GNAT superfamily N-acetyltransferase
MRSLGLGSAIEGGTVRQEREVVNTAKAVVFGPLTHPLLLLESPARFPDNLKFFFFMEPIEILEANLSREDHQKAVLELVDAYSRDPMGDGKPLSAEARARLIPGLQQHPTTLIFLAYQAGEPVGIAVCFRGFSTFAAQPLINIHDLNVLAAYRGKGIGQRLIAAVEAKARETGCCKLSLEVQENNHRARRSYTMAGFAQAHYQSEAGGALFLTKRL